MDTHTTELLNTMFIVRDQKNTAVETMENMLKFAPNPQVAAKFQQVLLVLKTQDDLLAMLGETMIHVDEKLGEMVKKLDQD